VLDKPCVFVGHGVFYGCVCFICECMLDMMCFMGVCVCFKGECVCFIHRVLSVSESIGYIVFVG